RVRFAVRTRRALPCLEPLWLARRSAGAGPQRAPRRHRRRGQGRHARSRHDRRARDVRRVRRRAGEFRGAQAGGWQRPHRGERAYEPARRSRRRHGAARRRHRLCRQHRPLDRAACPCPALSGRPHAARRLRLRAGSVLSLPSAASGPHTRADRGRHGMDLQLKDKAVFVAGGSRGIGLGIVETLLKEGARVAMTARGAEALEAERKRLAAQYGADRLWAMPGDMRDTATIEAALSGAEKALGPIWGAVANVGLFPSPLGFEVDDANWDAALTQNLDSSYRLARAALRRMTPRKEGAFVFISSIAGLGALGTTLTYGTSKAAMNHLSKELARLVG